MAVFSYLALNEIGVEVRGVLTGADRAEVLRILRAKNWSPLEVVIGSSLVDEYENQKGILELLNPFNLSRYGPVKALDQIVLFRQLTLMIRAGYTVLEALEATAKISEKVRLQKALKDMLARIQNGMTLSQSMLENKQVFSSLSANLVASGEASGDLVEVLERISVGMERSMEIKRDLVTSMIYPSIVFCLSLFVMYFAVASVIPKFVHFLSRRDITLPALTQFMVDMSDFLQLYGPWIGGGIVLTIFLLLAAYTFPKGKSLIDAGLLKIPLVGRFQVSANMASLGWITEMLLKSRITVMEAMHIIAKVTSNASYARIYQQSAERVLEGDQLSNGLRSKEVPTMVRHLVEVGEKTGELDTVMGEIGSYYARELRMQIKRMVALIEPVMLLFVGGIVALVYFSIFTAIWQAATLGR